ncbi:MAG: serine hydrolase [Armatimonadota bacterium]|nr:serine hydrolase [Armatimonadota bacterium]MDR7423420.1 serine hydrolase [Armatimonadota bacterium]MDR7456887.1 serine hydrolase [Armatimonadota bacterium]MDR7495618.1 serine hydrolase [Armatimonadota bacterium]
MKVRLFIDGAARGNPGPAALGVVVQDGRGRVLAELGEALGEATNNVAEYRALLRGLEEAAARGATEVEVCTDSDLLVRQITGEYRVKSAHLIPLHGRALRALGGFRAWQVRHVPREENAAADALANRALDEAAGAGATPRHRGARAGQATPPGSGATARGPRAGGASPRSRSAVFDHLCRGLTRVARGLRGTLGLGLKTTWDGAEFYLDPDRPFPMASVFKVPVLLELLMQAEEGRLRLEETIALDEAMKAPGSGVLKELTSRPALSLRDLALLMIIISDNTATDILVQRVGTDAINRRLAGWGFAVTRVVVDCRALLFDLAGRPVGASGPEARFEVERLLKTAPRVFTGRAYAATGTNVTTPREMTALLEMLVSPGRLPEGVRAQALDILRRQQVRDRLPLYLPPSAEIAHKTGSIAGVRNDAGILFVPPGPALICAFARDLESDLAGSAAIAEIGRLVYQAYA